MKNIITIVFVKLESRDYSVDKFCVFCLNFFNRAIFKTTPIDINFPSYAEKTMATIATFLSLVLL